LPDDVGAEAFSGPRRAVFLPFLLETGKRLVRSAAGVRGALAPRGEEEADRGEADEAEWPAALDPSCRRVVASKRDRWSRDPLKANPNTKDKWRWRFRQQLEKGWFRKPSWRLLSYVFPDWALERKLRKTYHVPVAEIAAGRFLDLGCGLGSCVALYARRTGRPAVGLDFAMPAVRYATDECRRLGIAASFVTGDAYRLPFAAGSFNSIYVGQVLEHLDDERAVIAEALRVLAPGGRIIISVPKGHACSGDGDADHVNFYESEADCRKLLADLPLDGIAFHPFHRHRFFFSATVHGR
jgi:SAM-dependent methyltransferase